MFYLVYLTYQSTCDTQWLCCVASIGSTVSGKRNDFPILDKQLSQDKGHAVCLHRRGYFLPIELQFNDRFRLTLSSCSLQISCLFLEFPKGYVPPEIFSYVNSAGNMLLLANLILYAGVFLFSPVLFAILFLQ